MIREQISKFKIDRLFNYFTLKLIPGILTNILRMPSLAESFTNGVGGLKTKINNFSEKINIEKIKNIKGKISNVKGSVLETSNKFKSVIGSSKKKKNENRPNNEENKDGVENETTEDNNEKSTIAAPEKEEEKPSEKKDSFVKRYKKWAKGIIKKLLRKIFKKIPIIKSIQAKRDQKKMLAGKNIVDEEKTTNDENVSNKESPLPTVADPGRKNKSNGKIASPVDVKASIEIDNNFKLNSSDSEDDIDQESLTKSSAGKNGLTKDDEINGITQVSKSTVKGAIKHIIDNGVNSLTKNKKEEEAIKLTENSRTISENSLVNIGQ